jgi:hypothetical protein
MWSTFDVEDIDTRQRNEQILDISVHYGTGASLLKAFFRFSLEIPVCIQRRIRPFFENK